MKSKLPVIIFLLFVFFLSTPFTVAQIPTVLPTPSTSFATETIDTISEKKLPEKLKEVRESTLPFAVQRGIKEADLIPVSIIPSVSQAAVISPAKEIKSKQDTAYGYAVKAADCTTEQVSSDANNFFGNLIGLILDILGIGNEKAKKSAKCVIPNTVVDESMAEINGQNRPVLLSDQNVLGNEKTNKAMEQSYDLMLQSELPYQVWSANYTTPVPTSSFDFPTGSPNNGCESPVNSKCDFGHGYCSPEYLGPLNPTGPYFSTEKAAKEASIICQGESNSEPLALNDNCLPETPYEKRTQDYSVGLFQYNLISSDARCPGAFVSVREEWEKKHQCTVADSAKLAKCVSNYQTPDVIIKKAVSMSGNGKDWSDWSVAKKCGLVGTQSVSLQEADEECINQPTENVAGCPAAADSIEVPGTEYKLLNYQGGCIRPKMIVIHWSGGWNNRYVTFNTLNQRQLACQLAADQNGQLAMQQFFSDQVQKGQCVGGYDRAGKAYNVYIVSNEITGFSFDAALDPSHSRYGELMKATEKALFSTCWMMRQYKIPATQIFGHFQLNSDKIDPGQKYLDYFVGRIQQMNCL